MLLSSLPSCLSALWGVLMWVWVHGGVCPRRSGAPRAGARSCHRNVHSPLIALGWAPVLLVLGCRLSWMLPCRPVAQETSKRSTNCCCSACQTCLCCATSPHDVPAIASMALSTSPAGLKRPAWRTRLRAGFCCSARQNRRSFHWIMSVTVSPPLAICPHSDQMRWRMNVDQRCIPSLCMRARAVRRERTCHSPHVSVAWRLRCIICL